MKTGIERIAAERQRQITEENWSAEHDDKHDAEELARAAAMYALPDNLRFADGKDSFYGTVWPWEPQWFKGAPKTGLPLNLLHSRIRELEKAGALIAAEIDRIQRIPVGKFFPESP